MSLSRSPSSLAFADRAGVWAVIPARDEAASIAEVVRTVRDFVEHVVVVDDASTDDTSALAAGAGARVLKLVNSMDAWGATQAGLRYATLHGANLVVTLDADGQHPAGCLPRLLEPIRAGQADVVIGSDPSRVSRQRHLAWHYLRMLTRLEVGDLTSGYRAYSQAALECLSRPQASLLNYQDVGVLMLLRAQGFRLSEVPVTMGPRWSGKSRVFSSWLKVLAYLLESSVLGLSKFGAAPATTRVR